MMTQTSDTGLRRVSCYIPCLNYFFQSENFNFILLLGHFRNVNAPVITGVAADVETGKVFPAQFNRQVKRADGPLLMLQTLKI